jgi:protein phosphatase
VNEDAVLADPPMVAIADGLGGHRAGEVASNLALQQLATWKDRLAGRTGRETAQTLREAFGDVNRVVFEKGQEDEAQQGMSTTLTAGWIESDTLSLAHVGDSRAYLLRAGTLKQLTEDQNVAQDLVRRGRISEEEAASSPQRHVVLQAIGIDTAELDIETSSVKLRPGDRVIFASDGLFGMLKSNDRLRDLLLEHQDRDAACRALINAANAAGGEDNISVVLIDVVGDAGAGGGEDEAPPVVVERDEPPSEPPQERSRRGTRTALIAGGAVVLLGAMALVLLVARSSTSLVLSARGDNVVVLEGKVGDATQAATGRVAYMFPRVTIDDFPETTQEDLQTGIEVESVTQARRVVRDLPRVLAPTDTPTPEPKASPKATATARPKRTPAP